MGVYGRYRENPQVDKYDRLKEQAIIALLTACNIEGAAKTLDIGVSTLYRWLQREDFQAELKEARRQAVNLAIGKLQQSSSKAVQVLQDVAENEEAPASARVSAAKTILEMALKAVEIEDIVKRLGQLEKMINEKG